MSLEIEIKMPMAGLDPDFSKVLAHLKAANASPVIRLAETNIFLDRPDHYLRQHDQGLRVRLEQDRDGKLPDEVIITHKGPRLPGVTKTRQETELVVNDVNAAVSLLAALGYVETLRFQKRRDRWLLDGCHVELDTLPRLGTFVEIEGPNEAAIQNVRKKLNLTHAPLEASGYAAMLAHDLEINGVSNRVVTF